MGDKEFERKEISRDVINPFKGRDQSPVVKDEEVTDILDDNDIVAPLM